MLCSALSSSLPALAIDPQTEKRVRLGSHFVSPTDFAMSGHRLKPQPLMVLLPINTEKMWSEVMEKDPNANGKELKREKAAREPR